MKPTIAVALSGGVDSLVTAWLLKQQGYPVIGVHFITGFEAADPAADRSPASIVDTARQALMPITDRLDIPLKIYDASNRFKTEVVDYFIAAYRAGQTPSPCLVCNPVIKFGDLMRFSCAQGADLMATGHYARILPADDGRVRLFRGIDPGKDQSYFLARLSRDQLMCTRFPLGEMNKAEVVSLARENHLVPVTAGESQDICFIQSGEYGKFMAGQSGFRSYPGPIVNTAGREIGRHKGLHLFTIGQRRGINCPAEVPYYVIRIEADNNRLVVGRREDLLTPTCRVVDINWIAEAPATPISVMVKIRYRHRAVRAMILPLGNRLVQVRFDQAQAAVTPGQGAVFYRSGEVLGGGWIVREEKTRSAA